MPASTTDYYLIVVDSGGDVSAMKLTEAPPLDSMPPVSERSFENQGADASSKWQSAADAVAAIMPEEDE